MNFTLPAILLFAVSASVVAQTKPLPNIQPPKELASGAYSEGTVTRLSTQDVAQFLPWAQNAQNTLTKTLKDSQLLPISDRLPKIENAIKSVVQNSGSKNYQMFMRFALNRGLLLVQELDKESGSYNIGIKESSLDILVRSINVALKFYESDLSFQKRAQEGNTSITLEYARFGTTFFSEILPAVQNIHDASAEFRLIYKLFEMVNWDLSRDSLAFNFSDQIVEIYQTLQLVEKSSQNNDQEVLTNIRRLMPMESSLILLRDKVEKLHRENEVKTGNACGLSGNLSKRLKDCGNRKLRLGDLLMRKNHINYIVSNDLGYYVVSYENGDVLDSESCKAISRELGLKRIDDESLCFMK